MDSSTSSLKIYRLSEKATLPLRKTTYAAGLDLFSAYDYYLPPKDNLLVLTDIQIALPTDCYGRIAARSGLALKKHIHIGAGVVDSDYRGNIGIVVFNLGDDGFHIKCGDRIAQFICERIALPEVEEVFIPLDTTTERACKGFGSTEKDCQKIQASDIEQLERSSLLKDCRDLGKKFLKCTAALVRAIDLDDFLNQFLELQFFTDDDIERIESRSTRSQKNREFLSQLQRKNPQVFPEFYGLLQKKGRKYTHILDRIHRD